jgi:hypothetical protein
MPGPTITLVKLSVPELAVLVNLTVMVLPASMSKYVTYLPLVLSAGRLLTPPESVVKANLTPEEFSTSTLKAAVAMVMENSSFSLRFLSATGTLRLDDVRVWLVAEAVSWKPVGITGSKGEPVAWREAVSPVAVQPVRSVVAEELVTTLSSPVPVPVVPVEGMVRTVGVKLENAILFDPR